MADGEQVGEGFYIKFGIDFSQMVGAGGAAAIVLNQTLQLFQQFESYGQQAFDATIGKAIEYQSVIEDLHNTLGMTNADAQKWQQTLVSFDTDVGSFSTSLRMLTQRVSDTGTAGDSLRATLKSIGVDAKDANGEYKNSSDLMEDILQKLGQFPEGTQKANLELEIFGRNWYNIANLVNNGTAAVENFHKQQPLFSDDELDRIDKAKIKIDEFSEKMNAAGALIGAGVIDYILNPIYNVGEIAGVEASSLGMEFAGASEGVTTGNWALSTEAQKRIMNPGAYTQEALAAQEAAAKGTGSGGAQQALTIPALLTGPETLQAKLDEITNTTLPNLRKAYDDAVNAPAQNLETINSTKKAFDDELQQQTDVTNQIRDQKLQYQQMIDITLPNLAEKLKTAKETGLKTEIEGAKIALDQGVNSANDLGEALGKAAISTDSIKSSITIASGWSSQSVIGEAGSEQASFMIDEMQHGASYQVALAAWMAGAHSYSPWMNGIGTLGAAIDSSATVTRNAGKNEREATAAAAKSGSSGAATPGTGTGTDAKTPADQSTADQKADTNYSTQYGTNTTTLKTLYAQRLTDFDNYGKFKLALEMYQENVDKTHWTAETEMMRISLQNMSDSWKEYFIFIGSHPTIHNIGVVNWTKNGPGLGSGSGCKVYADRPPCRNVVDKTGVFISGFLQRYIKHDLLRHRQDKIRRRCVYYSNAK